MLETKVRLAVKPQALQLLQQGVAGCGGVLQPQTIPSLGTGAWWVGTMSHIPASTLVWFSSSFSLIDTQSGVAMVGVQGGAWWYQTMTPGAEVEASVAPHSPALAPRGASGWGRRPPGPNEVVWSGWCSALHLSVHPSWGPQHSGGIWWWGTLLGLPALTPPTSSSQCTSPTLILGPTPTLPQYAPPPPNNPSHLTPTSPTNIPRICPAV